MLKRPEQDFFAYDLINHRLNGRTTAQAVQRAYILVIWAIDARTANETVAVSEVHPQSISGLSGAWLGPCRGHAETADTVRRPHLTQLLAAYRYFLLGRSGQ